MVKAAVRRPQSAMRYWLLALPAATAGAGLLTMVGFAFVSSLLASVLIVICLYPTFEYIRNDARDVPALPAIAGAYAMVYAFPVFAGDRRLDLIDGATEITEPSLVFALSLAIIGAIVLLVICNNVILKQIVSALPMLTLRPKPERALLFCAGIGLIGLAVAVIIPELEYMEGAYGSILRVIRNQTLVVIAIFAWLVYTTKSAPLRWIWYAVVVVAVIGGMSTGSLEKACAPLAVLCLCDLVYGRKINKWAPVVIVLILIFFSPVKSDVRQILIYDWPSNTAPTRLEKMSLWIEKASDYWAGVARGEHAHQDAAGVVIKRTNLIDVLAFITDQTPQYSPYLHGQTYMYFAYFMIPRMIWPDKPVADANRTLAVKYYLTTEAGAEKSTFGVGLLGEGYANFGAVGVLGISVVLGLVVLVMMRLFGGEAAGPGGAAILLSFLVYFFNGLGSSAEILFGNLFQSMLLSYLLLYWTADKAPASRPTLQRRD